MNDLYLEHHGILGQKWGVRRYQNEDGTLTELGKKRLSSQSDKINRYYQKSQNYGKGYGYRSRARNKYEKLIDESDANRYVKQAVSKDLETVTKSIDDYKN